jgi:two-component system, NarL family, sensor kinase
MGPYVGLNAILIGFFAFAAIHHFLLWLPSRRDTALLALAFLCALCALFSANIIGLVTARTPAEGQRALDLRLDVGLLCLVPAVWLVSLVSGVRARGFVWLVTSAALGIVLVNEAVRPLTGTVTGVERIVTSWGEPLSSLHRESASPWLAAAYVLPLATYLFGFVGAARLWNRDRLGGAILALAYAGLAAGWAWGAGIDIGGFRGLYVGAVPYATCVILMGVQIAREYRLRSVRLEAAEHRFRAIFDQTFQLTGLLGRDGTVLEANHTALEFAGVRAEDVIGRPFWETAWWTHSAPLQEQLREAVTAAAQGATVRFEATHRDADGRLHDIDFSVKPARDEQGAVVLLIPEGRDVTERKQGETERALLVHDLGERVKELTLLHRAASLLQENRPFDEDLLRELVVWLPPAWQYPEVCEGRIRYAGFEARTAGWGETPWQQSETFSTSDGRTGAIDVAYRDERPAEAEGPFLAEERRLLQSLARMLTTHLDRQRAEQAARMLSGRLVTAQEEERRRIARELHDEIGQILTVVKINIESLRESTLPESAATRVDACVENIGLALQQVRALALDLRPAILDHLGLPAALRWFVDRMPQGPLTHLAVEDDEGKTLSPEAKTAAFRIAQEAVTNVLRHARARNVWVTLACRPEELELTVRDDGRGFDLGGLRRAPASTFGLSSMEERARLVGGRIEITTTPGTGTEVRVRFPVAGA